MTVVRGLTKPRLVISRLKVPVTCLACPTKYGGCLAASRWDRRRPLPSALLRLPPRQGIALVSSRRARAVQPSSLSLRQDARGHAGNAVHYYSEHKRSVAATGTGSAARNLALAGRGTETSGRVRRMSSGGKRRRGGCAAQLLGLAIFRREAGARGHRSANVHQATNCRGFLFRVGARQ